MRNKLISVIFLLLIILLIRTLFWGVKIGNFEILSVPAIKEKDNLLEEKIQTASTLTNVDHPKAISELEKTYKNFQIKKEKYNELVDLVNNREDKYNDTKKYDISYMWELIGEYAKKHNLIIAMDLKKTKVDQFYNLNFKILGQFTNVSNLINEIENDSDLAFRIYNFILTRNVEEAQNVFSEQQIDKGEDKFDAFVTFTVKNIKLNDKTLK